MLKKHFFLITFLIIAATNSFGGAFAHSITIKIVSDSQQNTSPQNILIDPSKKSPSNYSLTLQKGEELIVEVSNPTQRLYNGELNDCNTDNAINCNWSINNWGTYQNYWNNRKPFEVVAMGNRAPSFFHYKAIREGCPATIINTH